MTGGLRYLDDPLTPISRMALWYRLHHRQSIGAFVFAGLATEQ